MRTVKFALASVAAILIGVFCVANGEHVAVRLWPDLTEYGVPASPVVEIWLFVVVLVAGLIGFLMGAAREWLREGRVRRSGRRARREAQALKAKVDELTRDSEDEDIPALASR